MKKSILISILATGVVGFAAWQYDLGKQDGAGETRPVALPQVSPQQTEPETKSAQPITKTEFDEKVQATEVLINSDAADDVTAKYVASGKPEQIMQHFAELRRARAELVVHQMQGETQDAQWADDLSQRFTFVKGMLPNLPDMQLAQTDCRQTICALHINMANEHYQQYLPYMQHIGTALGADAFVHHDTNPGEAVVYVARADMVLPDLEPQQE